MITHDGLRPTWASVSEVAWELNCLIQDTYDMLRDAQDDDARAEVRALAQDLSEAWGAAMRARAHLRALDVMDDGSHHPTPDSPADAQPAPW